ncbi:biopolymer transport protein ExbB/TolQ [Agrobacterium vitis]|nr:biopolymer transport protein ExbB/TolQ [Agrobacterium vitis]MBE1436867.1 biopolymer transport protein ExbB/TolQ [Agrobacterium vitis]
MSDVDVDAPDADQARYGSKLSSPAPIILTMLIFLIIIGFIAAILFRQAEQAFYTNPGLNGLILGVLAVGILLIFGHVIGLISEVRWFNHYQAVGTVDKVGREPKMLAPMRSLLGKHRSVALSASLLRSILDSIATRLDESRDTSRYLIGLLVFLGLLGTFWGLIGTIGSISNVIQSLDAGSGGQGSDVLQTLKNGLAAPLAGMGTAFSSSLLGLSGSLILGFLDLQAGRAQNRFYTELENWLSSVTDVSAEQRSAPDTMSAQTMNRLLEQMKQLSQSSAGADRNAAAIAGLSDGIQGLVKNMRNEQQMLRDWIEAQQEDARAMRKTLDRLNDKLGSK